MSVLPSSGTINPYPFNELNLEKSTHNTESTNKKQQNVRVFVKSQWSKFGIVSVSTKESPIVVRSLPEVPKVVADPSYWWS